MGLGGYPENKVQTSAFGIDWLVLSICFLLCERDKRASKRLKGSDVLSTVPHWPITEENTPASLFMTLRESCEGLMWESHAINAY